MSKINIKDVVKSINDKKGKSFLQQAGKKSIKPVENVIEKKALLQDTLIATASKRLAQGNAQAAEDLVNHAVSFGESKRIVPHIRDKAVNAITGTDDFITNLKTRSALNTAGVNATLVGIAKKDKNSEAYKRLTDKAKSHIYDNILAKQN